MGKVIARVRVTNVFEPECSRTLDAVVDTGARMMVLPQDCVQALRLTPIDGATVRYANGTTARRSVYGIVMVEMEGRRGHFDVLAEAEGTQPLIGQIVLEQLDLIVDPARRVVLPNPRSPDMPMIELL